MRKKKIWITSDTHFGHQRIIDYENRPFQSVEEMNKTLIDNWNSVVKCDDLVYHLGDFALNMPFEKVEEEILSKLNGDIILIAGNHDKDWLEKYRKCGRFKFVTGNKHKLIADEYVILSHHPIFLEERSPFINLYGHVHADDKYKTIARSGACCCVERWNYTPVDYEKLIKEVASKTEW